MRKSVLFLSLLLLVSFVSFVGCTPDEDLDEVLTVGTWKVGYLNKGNDEHTSLFYGYVFTFQPNGTVTVDRPGATPATGSWNSHDRDTRLEIEFGKIGLLEKVNDDWVIDFIDDTEVGMHEPGAPFNQLRFEQL